MRFAYDASPKIAGTLSRQTFDGDARYYQRLASTGVLAMRIRGFKSIGAYPDFPLLRRQLRDARLRLLAVRRAERGLCQRRTALPDHRSGADPIGVIGGVRGVFFADRRRWLVQQSAVQVRDIERQKFQPDRRLSARRDRERSCTTSTDRRRVPDLWAGKTISGFRLQDGRASYGLGLETFALGFPIHFDWSWRTLFNRSWEDEVSRAKAPTKDDRQQVVPQATVRALDWLRLLKA
jgi:hypothetical protein